METAIAFRSRKKASTFEKYLKVIPVGLCIKSFLTFGPPVLTNPFPNS
jgi:hypothetical protein